MKLLIVSHKACWELAGGGWATDGGFPFQIEFLSELFDETVLLATRALRPRPAGLSKLCGRRLRCEMFPEPRGQGVWRKLWLAGVWLPSNWLRLRRLFRGTDIVHALVPGDVGALGALLAQRMGCKLVVRHCGTWDHQGTLADRWLSAWLPRVAGQGVVVLATGGGKQPPPPGGPRLHWIFSTSLRERELGSLPSIEPWHPGQPLRLVFVGRLTRGKNAKAVVGALRELRSSLGEVELEIVGDGPERDRLRTQAKRAGVTSWVRLRGNVDHQEVLRLIGCSHLAVFPTEVAEGFPKAVLEALACGVPVLASPVSVLPELLSDGAGLLLDGSGSESVVRAVLALAGTPAALAEMGQKARRRAQEYTLERWRDRIGAILAAEWGPLRGGTA